MQGNQIPFGNDLFDLPVLARELRLQEVNEGLKSGGAITSGGIVLLVLRAQESHCPIIVFAIDRRLIEGGNYALVRGNGGAVRTPGTVSWRKQSAQHERRETGKPEDSGAFE